MAMACMRSGFAVIGDTQYLPGYSLLLCEHAAVNHLTDLPLQQRVHFLLDLSLSTYPPDERNDLKHRYDDAVHGELRSRIVRELKGLMREAYRGPNASEHP